HLTAFTLILCSFGYAIFTLAAITSPAGEVEADPSTSCQLYSAILSDDAPGFTALLDTHGAHYTNASCSRNLGDPLLHTAVIYDRLGLVKLLVARGADLNGLRDS